MIARQGHRIASDSARTAEVRYESAIPLPLDEESDLENYASRSP